MEPIDARRVEAALAAWRDVDVYLHLETTHGAYTKDGFGAFARNVRLRFQQAAVRGSGPFRVGLRLDNGWIYAEGLTHWQAQERAVLLAGHDQEGRLTVVLQLAREPWPTTVGVGPAEVVSIEPQPPDPAVDGPKATAAAPSRGSDSQPGLELQVPAPDERHLVVVLAHPDDEAFAAAGTMALAVRRGIPVTHVCVTTGQMGRRVGRPPAATRESLPALRARELQQALSILGVRDLRLLHVWDKTVEFQDVEALAGQLAAILQETNASTVITFHPQLGGHPDHNAVGAATVAAVRRLPPLQRPRVLVPLGPVANVELDWPLVRVPIGSVRPLKEAALRAHWSQTAGWEEQLRQDPELRQRLALRLEEERFWLYPLPPEKGT